MDNSLVQVIGLSPGASICHNRYFFKARWLKYQILVYIIAWSAVVLGINSTSNVGSNFHEAKPSEISCITSAINPYYHS